MVAKKEVESYSFVYVPRPFLMISTGLHGGVMLFALLGLLLKSLHWFPFLHQDESKVYENFMQVDILAMPELLLKDQQEIDVSLPVTAQKKNFLPMPVQSEKKNNEALSLDHKELIADLAKKKNMTEKIKISQEDALKKIEEEARREQAIMQLRKKKNTVKGRPQIAGNLPSQGMASLGAVGDAKDKYISTVIDVIRSHFNIYPWQKKTGLMTRVHLLIDKNGRIKDQKVLYSSHDLLYDSAVKLAIEAAEPFPVPTDLTLLKEGFDITFVP